MESIYVADGCWSVLRTFGLSPEHFGAPTVDIVVRYPLFDRYTGEPVGQDVYFVGKGTIVREAKVYLVIGDPSTQANLSEYRVADRPEPVSEAEAARFQAGALAASADHLAGKRRQARTFVKQGHDWTRGYDHAIDAIETALARYRSA